MKILCYGMNFAPELTSTGKYTSEMAFWLADQGHEVRVVTAPPHYPAWRISEGYSGLRYSRESIQGVEVFRTPLWVPAQPTGLTRLLHLASFALASLPSLLAQWRWKPDAVWVVEPAFMCAPAAVAFARLRGAKAWLHIQDYEVDAAFDLGLIKGQRLRRWVQSAERWLMNRFDRVSTISGRMMDRAKAKGVPDGKRVFVPNWVDISAIVPLRGASPYRAELGYGPGVTVALYSGNMGNKQGLEILADAARLLVERPDIQFVFGGGGAGLPDLEKRCAGLPNVRFLPIQPLERLSDFLGMADIHLLPQRADAADLVMPSKLTGMLASGRAVVATAHESTELGRVVTVGAACGLIVEPEHPESFAQAIAELADDPARRAAMGLAGRAYAERELDQETILKRFEAHLLACVAEPVLPEGRAA
jgi:colanic acid biosynthesis glycosyl transferase WcaI